MEGAEDYDFFRQPDCVTDPLLAGSYAVYKKETLIGEGTGKLCHIHRPQIIDSRGRRCRGALSVAGNELRITIPETWLSEAGYPVVVDPVIGTATVGSQYLWDNDDPGEEPVPLTFEHMLGVNRFLVPETLEGACTAYIYTNGDDPEAAGRPVCYSDSGDRPHARRSAGESLVSFRVSGSSPAGWRGGTFQTSGSIGAGSYVWFGVCAEYWWYPRFDYGAKCYRNWWDMYDSVPDTYPMADADHYYSFKLSMYFSYASAAQTHLRTLAQGVALNGGRVVRASYRRGAAETVRGEGLPRGLPLMIRNLAQKAGAGDAAHRLSAFFRRPGQAAGAAGGAGRNTQAKRVLGDTGGPGTATGRGLGARRDIAHEGGASAAFFRTAGYIRRFHDTSGGGAAPGVARGLVLRLVEAGAALYALKAGAGFGRGVADTVKNSAAAGGMAGLFRALSGTAGSGGGTGYFITRMRRVRDTGAAGDEMGRVADYLRGLVAEAGKIAEPARAGDYYRRQQDTAYGEAVPLRHLFIFLRLLAGAYIRDYIIGRFLKAREELVLKSKVTRELTVESSLH
jgi:hypothetical protein